MPERRRKYSPEYRDEAVKMVIESVSCEAVMGLPVEVWSG
jgi:transposase-like protein